MILNSELLVLTLAIVLGIVQILLAVGAATNARGVAWNLSSRDEVQAPLKGKAGRLDRALQNFKETFPLFLAAVVVVSLSQRGGGLSAAGAWLYLAARVVYVPVYALDITVVRSAVWGLSLAGIGLILLQLFV